MAEDACALVVGTIYALKWLINGDLGLLIPHFFEDPVVKPRKQRSCFHVETHLSLLEGRSDQNTGIWSFQDSMKTWGFI